MAKTRNIGHRREGKKRRFLVWLDRKIPGMRADESVVEMPADASNAQCDEACNDCLQTMIANELETGWEELPKATEPDEPGKEQP